MFSEFNSFDEQSIDEPLNFSFDNIYDDQNQEQSSKPKITFDFDDVIYNSNSKIKQSNNQDLKCLQTIDHVLSNIKPKKCSDNYLAYKFLYVYLVRQDYIYIRTSCNGAYNPTIRSSKQEIKNNYQNMKLKLLFAHQGWTDITGFFHKLKYQCINKNLPTNSSCHKISIVRKGMIYSQQEVEEVAKCIVEEIIKPIYFSCTKQKLDKDNQHQQLVYIKSLVVSQLGIKRHLMVHQFRSNSQICLIINVGRNEQQKRHLVYVSKILDLNKLNIDEMYITFKHNCLKYYDGQCSINHYWFNSQFDVNNFIEKIIKPYIKEYEMK